MFSERLFFGFYLTFSLSVRIPLRNHEYYLYTNIFDTFLSHFSGNYINLIKVATSSKYVHPFSASLVLESEAFINHFSEDMKHSRFNQ